MEILSLIRKFKAGYGNIGEILVVKDTCFVCYENRVCIYIDGSDGEYGGASICSDCVKEECAKYEN